MSEINANQQVNPLLSKIQLPGKIYQLPSKGIFYTDEIVNSVTDAEIHIHAMTAFDEICMKNPDMLFSGKALEAVCKSAVSDIIKPIDLLAKDVDALLIFLRMVSYGNYFDVEFQHNCENSKSHTYTIDLEKIIRSIKFIDPTTINEVYSLTLENGQKIRFNPIRYKHVLQILQNAESKKEFTPEDLKEILLSNVLNIIQSVDDITDKVLIREWLSQLPVTLMNKLTGHVEKLNDFGPDLNQKMKCKDCGAEIEVELPLNPMNFFSE